MSDEQKKRRQRLQERFLENRLNALSQQELLELLLHFAMPKRDAKALAEQLLEKFGSLHGVMDATPEELSDVEGISPNVATLMSLMSQLSEETEKSRQGGRITLRTQEEIQAHCERLLRGLHREHIYVVCLNAQSEWICNVLINRGSTSLVHASSRDIIKAALDNDAFKAVLCHNHPGGTLVPSPQDIDFTNNMAASLAPLNVELVDHVIVAKNTSMSMAAAGLIHPERSKNRLIRMERHPTLEKLGWYDDLPATEKEARNDEENVFDMAAWKRND